MGLIWSLYRWTADEKKPAHSSVMWHPLHSGMYSFFQSLMDLRAKRQSRLSIRQSWRL